MKVWRRSIAAAVCVGEIEEGTKNVHDGRIDGPVVQESY